MFRMRRIPAIVPVILLSLSSAFACWDKLLFLGHGLSIADIHKPEHPASILIYMNPDSQLPAADKDVHFQNLLKLVGHKPKSTESRMEFIRALTSGSYDIVVADLSDAGILKSQVEAAPGKPVLLPLLYKRSKEQLADAQKQFSCAFNADRNNRILRVLDEAMRSKQKGTNPQCQTF